MPQRTPLDVLTFLESYRHQPCLWNRSHPHFKNRAARAAAEEVLLPLSGLSDIRELRKKIRNIRCTYNQELGKIRRSVNSGSPVIYEPKLVWFNYADSFLRVNHIEKHEEPGPFEYWDSNGDLPFLKQEFREVEADYPAPSQSESAAAQPNPYKRLKTGSECNSVDESPLPPRELSETEAESPAEPFHAINSDQNEFVVFGQHVAAQLQRLPLEDAIRLEEEIQSAITRSRLRCLQSDHGPL